MKESLTSGSEVVNVPTVEPVGRFSARVEEERVRFVGLSLTSDTVMVKTLSVEREPESVERTRME